MSQRLEFVLLAQQSGANIRRLCTRFGISAKTGYKWLTRYRGEGPGGLNDRSRRPKRSPAQCGSAVSGEVLELYRQWGWGGRKLRRRLLDLGRAGVPAASTCTAILHRAGVFAGRSQRPPGPLRRFCRDQPNALLQMDFKGDFVTQSGRRCYPLAVLDDHSRFNLLLEPLANPSGIAVQQALERSLRRYGLPEEILCDNGPPWGCADGRGPHTSFTVWLLRLGVKVIHGRPYHPQTQGKQERFNRTLQRELLRQHTWRDLAHCAERFQWYRERYNCERPHDELAGDTPARHYQPSARAMPEQLPPLEYSAEMRVHTVRTGGFISFANQTWGIGRAFVGLPIGLRPSPQADGQWQVWFGHYQLGTMDLTTPLQPKHTLRSIYQQPANLFP